MIYAGTDLKFKITARGEGFSPSDDAFYVRVFDRFGHNKLLALKEDMLTDDYGNYYFTFPKAPNGTYYAEFVAMKRDYNFDDNFQRLVTVGYLCTVGATECKAVSQEGDGLTVCYERVWIVNVAEGVYLTDCYGEPIVDCDGNKIMLREGNSTSSDVKLNMTGAQFKDLMESRNENGVIDTIPEALDTIKNIGDDTELEVMTNGEVQSMMDRILSNS